MVFKYERNMKLSICYTKTFVILIGTTLIYKSGKFQLLGYISFIF